MSIDDNKEALQTMRNSIGSMENRMREIYNKGYKDGVKEGISQAMMKIADRLDRKTEQNSSEFPNNCDTCKHNGEKHAYDYACDKCTDMDKFQHEDEPQTDCAWK